MAHKDFHKRIRTAQKREVFRLLFREELITQSYSHQAKPSSFRQAAFREKKQNCREINQASGEM